MENKLNHLKKLFLNPYKSYYSQSNLGWSHAHLFGSGALTTWK